MAQFYGLWSQNFNSGTEELIAVWKQATIHRVGNAWRRGPGINLTASKDTYMASFLNEVFLVNYTDNNWNYQEGFWSQTHNVSDSPIAQFIANHQVRLFLYKIKINGVEYPSRCWYSDLPKGNTITWGLETGTNLVQTASSQIITSAGSTFITNNIKVGDPFTIEGGTNAGTYTVQSVDSETQITLVETITNSTSGSTFWVGSNYFDVQTDDGDMGTGIGVTSNEIYLFKKKSVHRYNISGNELRQVNIDVGTTSPRSIISKGQYVYYYHPSGFYRVAGTDGEFIGNPLGDIIEGITDGTNPVGWKNEIEDTLNWFVGDVTLSDGEVISKCVASFEENSEIWTLKSYDKTFVVATNWLHAGVPEVYVGDTADAIHQIDIGTDFNGADIPSILDTRAVFPAGSEAIVDFSRLRAYIENGPDVQIYYKLYYKPSNTPGQWFNDDDWKPMIGSQVGSRAEWKFQPNARASGVKFRVIESSANESHLIEKLVIFWANQANY